MADTDKEPIFQTEDSPTDLTGHVPGKVERGYEETTRMEYPNIVMKTDVIEMFRINTLRGILEPKTLLENEDTLYSVYVAVPEGMVQTGYISSSRLSVLLNSHIFKAMEITANLDSETQLEGDLVHALCQINGRSLS